MTTIFFLSKRLRRLYNNDNALQPNAEKKKKKKKPRATLYVITFYFEVLESLPEKKANHLSMKTKVSNSFTIKHHR